jgi:hypothetical protein
MRNPAKLYVKEHYPKRKDSCTIVVVQVFHHMGPTPCVYKSAQQLCINQLSDPNS